MENVCVCLLHIHPTVFVLYHSGLAGYFGSATCNIRCGILRIVRRALLWNVFCLLVNERIDLLDYFLLIPPPSSSMDFFSRTISASFFISSRFNNSIWYSSFSSFVNSLRRSYFDSGFPTFFWFSSSASPPDRYLRFHLRILPSLIPSSLPSALGDSAWQIPFYNF